MSRVMALNDKGELTWCSANPEDRGKGRCNHVKHQEDNETNEEFIERANKIYKDQQIEIRRYKMSDEEKENLPIMKGRKDLADEDNMGGRIELPYPLWNEMDKNAFSRISGIKKSSITSILKSESSVVVAVDKEIAVSKLEVGDIVPNKKIETKPEYYVGIQFNTGVLGLNEYAKKYKFEATTDVYVVPYYMRQDVPETDPTKEKTKHPLNVLYNSLILNRTRGGDKVTPEQRAQRKQLDYERLLNNQELEDAEKIKGYKIPGLSEGFAGKGGIFKGLLEGSNMAYTGRAVTTPDIHMEYDNIALPPEIIVTIFEPSIKELARKRTGGKYSDRDIDLWINQYKNVDQEKLTENQRYELEKVVEAMGRRVLAVRQPTLHKSSFLSMGVKVSPDNTIHQNPLNIEGWSADFDGDTLTVFALNDKSISDLSSKVMGGYSDQALRRPRLQNNSINLPSKDALLGLLQIIKNKKDKK